MATKTESSQAQDQQEQRKRKREIVYIFVISFLFLGLTWFEVRLFNTSQQLPFVHSIFFFGLVNFNIILLLLLLFLIFRNLVKVFVERRGKIFGSSLKGKLIAAFVVFSTVPTVLLFLASFFYINVSFDKWFSVKMAGVLKSSLEVTNAYYFNAKKRNYHFAHEVAKVVDRRDFNSLPKKLEEMRSLYALDAVEFYPSLIGDRIIALAEDETVPDIPPLPIEILKKGLQLKVDGSTIHQFAEGNLVRVIVPVSDRVSKGAVVVSSFVPLSLISKMNDISQAYEEFRDINPLEYPLKSIYVTILLMMTLVILFAATWFGFHLAKQLSVPLVQLGRATRRVAGGDYTPVEVRTGSEEIISLVASFNQMTQNLEKSEYEVKDANENLRKTLKEVDKYARYVEVVLRNVSAGVISVDQKGIVTTINRRAGDLLRIEPEKFIGRPVRELLTREYFRTFSELLRTMSQHKIESIQRELKVNIQGEAVPFLMTLSILKNDRSEEIGKILVFDDMTPIMNAQRAQAWTEVARRIAHEIKNPLTPIKLSAERLRRKFSELITDPAFDESTRMIIQQTEDLKNLVNEFNQFARLPQSKPVTGNLHNVIQASLAIFTSSHPQVSFDLQLDSSLPEFKFDPDQFKRVLFNLIDNAIAASGKQETPMVQIMTKYDADLKLARLSIADFGEGIPDKERARVFEPYFSTKAEGTGLGLAIVKRIVEDHSGYIRALPNQPHGTKMLVEIPVHQVDAWTP